MGARSLEAFGRHLCRPSTSPGFRPRIRVRPRTCSCRKDEVGRRVDVGGGIAVESAIFRGMLVRDCHSRLRGNDEWGVAGALESRLSAFFVPMTNWGSGRTSLQAWCWEASSSHADRLGARIHSGFPTFRCSRRIGRQQLTGSTIYRQAVQSGLGTTRRLLARIA